MVKKETATTAKYEEAVSWMAELKKAVFYLPHEWAGGKKCGFIGTTENGVAVVGEALTAPGALLNAAEKAVIQEKLDL